MSDLIADQERAIDLQHWLRLEWPRVRDWLLPAIDAMGGTHTEHDIISAILCQAMQLWPGDRAATVTELVTYPQLRALNVVLAGGDLGEIETELRPRMMAFGRAVGCSRIELTGRPGWEKVFRGATKRAVVLTEDL